MRQAKKGVPDGGGAALIQIPDGSSEPHQYHHVTENTSTGSSGGTSATRTASRKRTAGRISSLLKAKLTQKLLFRHKRLEGRRGTVESAAARSKSARTTKTKKNNNKKKTTGGSHHGSTSKQRKQNRADRANKAAAASSLKDTRQQQQQAPPPPRSIDIFIQTTSSTDTDQTSSVITTSPTLSTVTSWEDDSPHTPRTTSENETAPPILEIGLGNDETFKETRVEENVASTQSATTFFALLGGIILGAAVMAFMPLLTPSPLLYISPLVTLSMCVWVLCQRHCNDTKGGGQKQQKALHHSLCLQRKGLHSSNTSLSRRSGMLQTRLALAKSHLPVVPTIINDDDRTALDRVLQLVQQREATLREIQRRLEQQVLMTISRTMLICNRDSSSVVLNRLGLELLTARLKSIPGITVDARALKALVFKPHQGNQGALLALFRHAKSGSPSPIFLYNPLEAAPGLTRKRRR